MLNLVFLRRNNLFISLYIFLNIMLLIFIHLYWAKYCPCSSFVTRYIPSIKDKLLSFFKNSGERNRPKMCCKATVPQTHFKQQIILLHSMIIYFWVLIRRVFDKLRQTPLCFCPHIFDMICIHENINFKSIKKTWRYYKTVV